jgi:hypothetical protein
MKRDGALIVGPAIGLPADGERGGVVHHDEGSVHHPLLEDPALALDAPPGERHLEEHLVLRDPAQVELLDRHSPVVEDHQEDAGESRGELVEPRRDVEVPPAEGPKDVDVRP